MKSELQKELERFKELKTKASGDTSWIDKTIADLESQLGIQQEKTEEQRKVIEDQKFDELKNIVEASNLNEVLGHPEANKIVHKLLYDQSMDHLEEIDKIKAEHNEQIGTMAAQHANDIKSLLEEKQSVLDENLVLKSEIEDARKDARFQLNEATRLKQQVDRLQAQLDDEKNRRTEYKPSESLQELLEGAKAVTEQRKIKITNVQPVNDKETHFTADSENGETITIPHYALKAYEQVERLPMPKEVTDEDIKQQSVVVQEAAKQAEQFQNVVQSDGAGSTPQDGAEKAVADAEPKESEEVDTDTVPYTGEVALQMQINALRHDVDQLIAWKEQRSVQTVSQQ